MKLKLKVSYLLFLILLVGILLFGCATNQGNNNRENNINVQQDANVQPDTPMQPGAIEFSVPSELPIAYVGKPYFYSFCNPQPAEKPDEYMGTKVCGVDVTSINPKGGTPPYGVGIRQYTTDISKSPDWFVLGLYVESSGILNFTPTRGDDGQYVLAVCVSDSGDNYNAPPLCKNTTLYIMSDTVTVKGEGELTHYLLLQLNSKVRAADFRGTEDEKDIKTNYVRAASFSSPKVTAEVPAAPPYPSCEHFCGGGSFAGQEVTATDTSVLVVADGNAACGVALGPNFPGEYNVDYYMVGYVGWGIENTDVALNITNTGTTVKAIDVHLEVSSELDSRSQNYYGATANAEACIGSDCINVPTGKRGDQVVNSTVLRVLVRPGSHSINVGSMTDSFANTNMLSCPSFVKASSKVSLTIVPADMSDGKKEVGRIWSYHTKYESGSGVK